MAEISNSEKSLGSTKLPSMQVLASESGISYLSGKLNARKSLLWLHLEVLTLTPTVGKLSEEFINLAFVLVRLQKDLRRFLFLCICHCQFKRVKIVRHNRRDFGASVGR